MTTDFVLVWSDPVLEIHQFPVRSGCCFFPVVEIRSGQVVKFTGLVRSDCQMFASFVPPECLQNHEHLLNKSIKSDRMLRKSIKLSIFAKTNFANTTFLVHTKLIKYLIILLMYVLILFKIYRYYVSKIIWIWLRKYQFIKI